VGNWDSIQMRIGQSLRCFYPHKLKKFKFKIKKNINKKFIIKKIKKNFKKKKTTKVGNMVLSFSYYL